ncbi:hypothetical protein D9J65_23090 [Escherichia coli]|nr:hypothetical protein [Escherichia coli]MHT87947.1 hypothetical protein [Escherichia coli]
MTVKWLRQAPEPPGTAATAVLRRHAAFEPAGACASALLHVAQAKEPNAGASRAPQPATSTRSARPFPATT